MDQTINQEAQPVNNADTLNLDFVKRRQYVRIYYPTDCPQKFLPELIIHYRAYQILDISEGGIRFYVPHMSLIHGDIVTGAIKFTDNTFIDIEGQIVRKERNQIALRFVKGIPYSRIMSEQMRLRNLEKNGLISYVDK